MSKINKFIGQQITLLRSRKLINKVDFAKKINISRTQLSNIESGNNGTTSEKLFYISIILGCNISDLFPSSEKHLVDYVPLTKEKKAQSRIEDRIFKLQAELEAIKNK